VCVGHHGERLGLQNALHAQGGGHGLAQEDGARDELAEHSRVVAGHLLGGHRGAHRLRRAGGDDAKSAVVGHGPVGRVVLCRVSIHVGRSDEG
jgi:hypothetical protein